MFGLLGTKSFDSFISLTYKIAKRYAVEIRHQTAVTYTSKLSSDGP